MRIQDTAEGRRLEENRRRVRYWRRWGPYLSDRQWGTVREDYSASGAAWEYFTFDQARSRVYRWGEDGIAGICDNHQRLCFALALWNGADAILKERFFGLSNHQGNHGEDVKEYWFHLDNLPSHAYMKLLYKYPQRAFPYQQLIDENQRRRRHEPGAYEYELLDTGVFDEDRYFDVLVEYAKADDEDILVRIAATNRGPAPARLVLLPTIWLRNTWAWNEGALRPRLQRQDDGGGARIIHAQQIPGLFDRWLHCQNPDRLIFTENETNRARLGWGENIAPHVKDGFHDLLILGRENAVDGRSGTKAAALHELTLAGGQTSVIRLRLTDRVHPSPFDTQFERMFQQRREEADEFYQAVCPFQMSADWWRVQRQAFAGLLWNKQHYSYTVQRWIAGDPTQPPPPHSRRCGRNHEWVHVFSDDIISMPDKWEYPWFAAWDLAFHTIALVMIDPELAKRQLLLLTKDWYMHPSGQLPAYEWQLGDVNPPVQAWAAWRVYTIEKKMYGRGDLGFLERIFHKLLLYFTWWVNLKDADGNNVFQGGFLGLDNIGVFDRSKPLPVGGRIDECDATSWMGMYCLNMLRLALELVHHNPDYEDMVDKFFQHFLYIASALNTIGGHDESLWDERDGFYYDILRLPAHDTEQHRFVSLRVRSMIGLVPLFAVDLIGQKDFESPNLAGFRRRFQWFMENRRDLTRHDNISLIRAPGGRDEGMMLSIVNVDKLRRILSRVLDESEFLSPYGVRALSKVHRDHPFVFEMDDVRRTVRYEPAESGNLDFGGNSNWRGPVWMPMNYLLIEALQKFHHYLGDSYRVECPTGSGRMLTLWEVAVELTRRQIGLFVCDDSGRRPVFGGTEKLQSDPHWRNLLLFFEYYNGDDGAGIGASHQTGWSALVAKLIRQWAEYPGQHQPPR